jgi:hypothetical protein
MKTRLFLLVGCFLAGCAVTTQGLRSDDPAAAAPDVAEAPAASHPDAPRQSADALPPLDDAGEVGSGRVTPPITGHCGMEEVQHFVGQPRTSVPRSAMPDNYRVVGPNSPVTMDYRADRLTIRVNEQDVVESMVCG